jgi:hypothetical protein
MELYLHFPNMPSWRGVWLKKRTGATLPLPLSNANQTSPSFAAPKVVVTKSQQYN